MASMMETLGIDKLSVDERLQLIDEIWLSLGPDVDNRPLTAEQMAELDRRLADAETNPDQGSPWEEVKARLLDEHGRASAATPVPRRYHDVSTRHRRGDSQALAR